MTHYPSWRSENKEAEGGAALKQSSSRREAFSVTWDPKVAAPHLISMFIQYGMARGTLVWS